MYQVLVPLVTCDLNKYRLQSCISADGCFLEGYRGIYGLSCNLWVIVAFVFLIPNYIPVTIDETQYRKERGDCDSSRFFYATSIC